tara:strand:- start:93 stop:959 length:867 start_codon:yes stop_codon:yes gene_type:complete
MAEPKYYADDKAILEEMIRLEKQKKDAQAMGVLGAGTIGLDAVGLKALGTMGRIGTRMSPTEPRKFLSEYDEMMDAIQSDTIDSVTEPYITEVDRLKNVRSDLYKEMSDDLSDVEKSIARERFVAEESPNIIMTPMGPIPIGGASKKAQEQTDAGLEMLRDYYGPNISRDISDSRLYRDKLKSQGEIHALERARRSENMHRDIDISERANELLKQQQRGYNELAAATIPFVGGADMMYSAYQDYVNAQNQIEKMMKQATPEQKAEFEKKLKEERMKEYQLKDSDLKFK